MLLFARKGWRSSVSRFNSSPVTIFPGRFQPGGKFIGSLVSGIRRRGSKYISHMKIEYFCKPATGPGTWTWTWTWASQYCFRFTRYIVHFVMMGRLTSLSVLIILRKGSWDKEQTKLIMVLVIGSGIESFIDKQRDKGFVTYVCIQHTLAE